MEPCCQISQSQSKLNLPLKVRAQVASLCSQPHKGLKEQVIAKGTERLEQNTKSPSHCTFYSQECYLKPQMHFLLRSVLRVMDRAAHRNLFSPRTAQLGCYSQPNSNSSFFDRLFIQNMNNKGLSRTLQGPKKIYRKCL